jgi:hypothetical protein
VLEGDALISFCGGFATRGLGLFTISIVLEGMRDLKDYSTVKGIVAPNPDSIFNIKPIPLR